MRYSNPAPCDILYVFQLAKQQSEKPERDCLKIYELYVYGGKLCRLYLQNHTATVDDDDESFLHNAWRGAESYFFLKKWHSLFSKERYYNAMCVAYKMQDYVKYLPQEVIYFALAVSAFRCQHHGVCSQAFMKLQSLKHVSCNK